MQQEKKEKEKEEIKEKIKVDFEEKLQKAETEKSELMKELEYYKKMMNQK